MKALENRTNGSVASRRKPQLSSFQKVKAYTNASSIVLELFNRTRIKGMFLRDALLKACSAQT